MVDIKPPEFSVSAYDCGIVDDPEIKKISTLRRIRELDIRKSPGFSVLDRYQAQAALETMEIMRLLIGGAIIDIDNLESVADFGAGGGGPTFVLKKLADESDGSVVALEKYSQIAESIVRLGILPQSKIISGISGINYLNKSPGEFGLITAFMYGPDLTAAYLINLTFACASSLKNNGSLVLTSDSYSFFAALKRCQQADVAFKWIDSDYLRYTNRVKLICQIDIPNILIIPKESCGKIK